jgi:hypothetical protein
MTDAEKLAIKNELTNDPLELGLTTAPEDDEANSIILNEVRDSILVYRASVPVNNLVIPVDELSALSPGQQLSWQIESVDGSFSPADYEQNFFSMFAENTQSRALWESVTKEPTSRARQLLGRYVELTASDVANARQYTP